MNQLLTTVSTTPIPTSTHESDADGKLHQIQWQILHAVTRFNPETYPVIPKGHAWKLS